MLTPKELYETYSINPCGYVYSSTNPGGLSAGNGSPFDFNRIIRFLKHVKHPCYGEIDTTEIDGTGAGQLALPFKFLQKLDVEAFAEGQPQVDSGTAYAIRNAADITRACYLTTNNAINNWSARMATEYIEHFCGNSLPDCLMMIGPDLVDEPTAYDRTPSSMGCFYYGASARFFCYSPPGVDTPPICVCGVVPFVGDADPCPPENNDPCCKPDPIFENDCCSVGRTSRAEFSYRVPVDDIGGSSVDSYIMKHVGILERKDYGGYANFVTRSGGNFHAILDDIFLNYFRDTYQPDKCRTISAVINITKNKTTITTHTTSMTNDIKDLLYNGYGIVLISNVGFPNSRDSTGLSYPDRIWYQTYNIIGYDDRKIEYEECVYVLSCPFGDWIDGGHPSWGPLPPGCFLVTESHLRCMLNFSPGMDFYSCRKTFCNPLLYNCNEKQVAAQFAGCDGAPEEGKCYPYYCTPQQSAFGMVFALSMNDGFPKQELNHSDFYPVTIIREQTKEQSIYFDPN